MFALTVLEVVIAIVGAALTGTTLEDALDSYLVTNCAIGFSCAASGVLIAWHRPRNPVGWLLAAAGVLYPMTAAVSPALTAAFDRRWSNDVIRTVLTVYFAAWPWAITLCLPLALLLFPTGRMPSPRWTWLVWVGAIGGTVSAIGQATTPSEFGPNTWIALPNHHQLALLWQLADWTVDAIYLASLVLLVVRFRRGDEKLRRQLLWLVLSLTIAIVVQAFWGPLVDGLAVLNLLSIALIPISMTIAVLRYQLLDIRLVLSRTVLVPAVVGRSPRRLPGAGRRRGAGAQRSRSGHHGGDHPADRGRVQPGSRPAAATGGPRPVRRSGRSGPGGVPDRRATRRR